MIIPCTGIIVEKKSADNLPAEKSIRRTGCRLDILDRRLHPHPVFLVSVHHYHLASLLSVPVLLLGPAAFPLPIVLLDLLPLRCLGLSGLHWHQVFLLCP